MGRGNVTGGISRHLGGLTIRDRARTGEYLVGGSAGGPEEAGVMSMARLCRPHWAFKIFWGSILFCTLYSIFCLVEIHQNKNYK